MTLLQLHFDNSYAQFDKKTRKIAVAWSGGADSTALLLSLQEQGFDVLAWHVDHGWHAKSALQANDLKQKSKAWGIPFKTLKVVKPEKNIEAESRRLRYDSFLILAEETGVFDVAFGHHADDQAETVCMRLLQGAGIAGCQGMRGLRKHQALNIWRPFLRMPKQNIERYLKGKGADWLTDPSNNDLTIWRNKIRHTLFPKMRENGFEPNSLFLRYQTQAERLQSLIESSAKVVKIDKVGLGEKAFCTLDWREWLAQREPVRVYLLQKMIGILFADGKVFGRRHIEAIEQWKKHGGNGWVSLSGCYLYKQENSLKLCQGNKV